ncbi:MAG: 1-deoxy-D-xylulose-5-phosphate synthase, partial [Deltaproteobacteria bacterium]|nr:1-deoxy-D-xylulose-5-phosphate synthase [Deltaproteobacteria bacterium]
MRSAFARKLKELAGRNGNIHLITADTGFTVFDDFQKEFPDRYLNIGIMESAMIGVAAGLALSGKTVFVYGIIPFVTMRCFEQIRTP